MKKIMGIFAVFLWPLLLLGAQPNYFYDQEGVRYELYRTGGESAYNWLFFPGGPGADSRYFYSLVEMLEIPGNIWLVDLPGNGDNVTKESSEDFDRWETIFPQIIQRFENPILVGHSFGGMFPLLFPELEDLLKGFIILNSAPSLWQEGAAHYAKTHELPDLSVEMGNFVSDPCQETFNLALDACMPYYFPTHSLSEGRKLLADVPCQFLPAVWWQRKAVETNFTAKWIPNKVPTLIIGGKYDGICPFFLYKEDKRFRRDNIKLICFEGGHIPWLESPTQVKQTIEAFAAKVL